jgi:hypothetical protein
LKKAILAKLKQNWENYEGSISSLSQVAHPYLDAVWLQSAQDIACGTQSHLMAGLPVISALFSRNDN